MTFYNQACVVNIYDRGNKAKHGTCCGILLNTQTGIVLSHASCLEPFVQNTDLDLHQLILNGLQRLECEVLLQKQSKRAPALDEKGLMLSPVDSNNVYGFPFSSTVNSHTDSHAISFEVNRQQIDGVANLRQPCHDFYAYSKFAATPNGVYQCQAVAESLDKLMPSSSWELTDRRDHHEATDIRTRNDVNKNSHCGTDKTKLEELSRQLLSSFIVLKLEQWIPFTSTVSVRSASQCCLGERVEIVSTPFGGLKPDTFMNSYSTGVVSNLAGKHNCLLLSDARCVLGGEGSPLYTFGNSHDLVTRSLTGIVIASLCWKSDEWVGFCVACDISAVLRSLPSHVQHMFGDGVNSAIASSTSLLAPLSCHSAALSETVMKGEIEVVMVKMAHTWGSGVVVDKERNIILTCSHVIKDSNIYPVEIKKSGQGRLEKVQVIYQQEPLRHQFDLAVVQGQASNHTWSQSLLAAVAVPFEGMEVLVVGHALFDLSHNLQPSVTSGVISKVIRVNRVPVMIQATCAVHPGASGGALVDTRGRLLGIIVCNARDNTTGASFPHINMSIPLCTVWPVIVKYIHSQDAQHLKSLSIRNRVVDAIWSLEPAQTLVDKYQSKL